MNRLTSLALAAHLAGCTTDQTDHTFTQDSAEALVPVPDWVEPESPVKNPRCETSKKLADRIEGLLAHAGTSESISSAMHKRTEEIASACDNGQGYAVERDIGASRIVFPSTQDELGVALSNEAFAFIYGQGYAMDLSTEQSALGLGLERMATLSQSRHMPNGIALGLAEAASTLDAGSNCAQIDAQMREGIGRSKGGIQVGWILAQNMNAVDCNSDFNRGGIVVTGYTPAP